MALARRLPVPDSIDKRTVRSLQRTIPRLAHTPHLIGLLVLAEPDIEVLKAGSLANSLLGQIKGADWRPVGAGRHWREVHFATRPSWNAHVDNARQLGVERDTSELRDH